MSWETCSFIDQFVFVFVFPMPFVLSHDISQSNKTILSDDRPGD